jgi:hypothetical protein
MSKTKRKNVQQLQDVANRRMDTLNTYFLRTPCPHLLKTDRIPERCPALNFHLKKIVITLKHTRISGGEEGTVFTDKK